MTLSHLRPTITLLTLLTLLFGFVYPGISTLIVQSIFHARAEGSLLRTEDGTVRGSEWIGQNFTSPKYFWGRLSAAGYNAAASSGSNLAPANPALLDAVKARIAALKAADPANTRPIPVDLVTASGSGLDPEISIAAAEYQVARVAKARGISETQVRKLVKHFTSHRQFGILGEPRVHVLQLNMALDGKN